MTNDELIALVREKEHDLQEKQEELDSQREMLSAAVDELAKYNRNLEAALGTVKEQKADLEKLLYQSSHGLRSPLSSIQGILNLMRAEPMTDALEDYRQYIDRKSGHMLEILNSLSTLSTLITKNVTRELVNVDDLVVELMAYFSKLAAANKVRFEFTKYGKSETCWTDPFLIEAFLKQIVMNALIFREPQREGFVSIRTSVEGEFLKFRIEDDGDGIDPAIGNRMFEIFFRGSGKSGGSGMGLHIARRAVDLLQGSITFARGQRGSIFEIIIPLPMDRWSDAVASR